MGRGRLTTDDEADSGGPGTGGGAGARGNWICCCCCFFGAVPAVLTIASTAAGSSYSMLFTNKIVRCCLAGSLSSTFKPRARGLDGKPLVGRRWSGVLVGSGGGASGEGGSVRDGRMLLMRMGLSGDP